MDDRTPLDTVRQRLESGETTEAHVRLDSHASLHARSQSAVMDALDQFCGDELAAHQAAKETVLKKLTNLSAFFHKEDPELRHCSIHVFHLFEDELTKVERAVWRIGDTEWDGQGIRFVVQVGSSVGYVTRVDTSAHHPTARTEPLTDATLSSLKLCELLDLGRLIFDATAAFRLRTKLVNTLQQIEKDLEEAIEVPRSSIQEEKIFITKASWWERFMQLWHR